MILAQVSRGRSYSTPVGVRKVLPGFAMVLLFAALWGACGGGSTPPPPDGGNPGTPLGTYSLTVSAASGEAVKTLPLTLTVN